MDGREYELNTSHLSCLPLSGAVPLRYFQGNLHFSFFFRHSFRVWGSKAKINKPIEKKEQDRKNCVNHCASTRCFTKTTIAQFKYRFVQTWSLEGLKVNSTPSMAFGENHGLSLHNRLVAQQDKWTFQGSTYPQNTMNYFCSLISIKCFP